MIKKWCCTLVLLASCVSAGAGSVSGVHVIWVNLSKAPKMVDDRVAAYMHSAAAREACWEENSLLFMHARPKNLNNELVRAAVIGNNAIAQKKVNAILRVPFRDAVAGFDGIIVYSDEHRSTYYGMTTGRRKVATLDVNPQNADIGICVVMPDAVRKP
jgi:hypothetical protein